MIKKLLVPTFLVFAVLVLVPSLSNAAPLDGVWKDPTGVTVHLSQHGDTVTGHYTGGAGHSGLTGTISGTFDGVNFVGHYQNQEGNISGKGTINLTLKGHTLEGRWQGITFPNQSGVWVLTKQ